MSQKPLRRVGVIGDVHTEDASLEAALRHFDSMSLDAVLCVGDIVDGPGDAERTCELLQARGVICVRGNHERWFLAGGERFVPEWTRFEAVSERSNAFLAALPETWPFETDAGPALLCHGIGRDDMACLTADDYGYGLENNTALWRLHGAGDVRWMIGGHTHRRMVRRFDHLTVLNAGTLHRPHDPCVMVVDFAALEAEFHDLGRDGFSLSKRVALRP